MKKYIVIEVEDIEKYLSDTEKVHLGNLIEKICDFRQIIGGRSRVTEIQHTVNGKPIRIASLRAAIKYLQEFDMCNIDSCPTDCERCHINSPCKKIEEFNFMKNEAIAAIEKELAIYEN